MNNYRNIHSSRGFTLIEALVALIVLAVGLLSLAQFHTNLVSSGALTKTRTEAINVAQEKLEELRNNIEVTDYTGLVSSTSGTQETVNGTNAIYTVSWTVGNVPNSLQAKVITVSASWTGRDGTTQTISLVSNIAWNNPVTSVALAGAGVANPLIETPKGSAEFVDDREYTDSNGDPSLPQGATDNDDGTQTYQDGDTYELIDEATGDVILELDCANNTCAGFVTISGTVVIDDGDVTATDVNVMASDVAFCARSIDDATTTPVGVYPTGATGNGIDYSFFTYTCYLGHGWYGNIGILRTDNANSNERVCLGDPTVASNDTYYPTVNNNRTYRGLFNLSTDNGTPPIYYSFGADAGTTITGHDFFLDTITGNNVTGADCITPMTNDYEGNADGTGTGTNIFAGVPDNFYCLNPHITTPTGFDAASSCAIDPTNSNLTVHTVTGEIVATTEAAFNNMTDNTSVVTSDGETCGLAVNDTYGRDGVFATYECTANDWGGGWSGTISVNTPDTAACTPENYDYTTTLLEADATNKDFECVEQISTTTFEVSGIVTGLGDTPVAEISATSDAECSIRSGGFSCQMSYLSNTSGWTGSIMLYPALAGAECTPSFYTQDTAITEDPGTFNFECTVAETVTFEIIGTISGIGDTSTAELYGSPDAICDFKTGGYKCDVSYLSTSDGWIGGISLYKSGYLCEPSSHYAEAPLTSDPGSYNFSCTEELIPQQFTISGSVDAGNIASVTISDGGTCSNTNSTYSCTTAIFYGDTWSGSVSMSTNKTVCDSPATFTNITGDTTYNFNGEVQARNCP